MKEIKVKDIIETTNGKLISGDENENLKNFKKDTREINLGDTYVGIKGEKVDGSTLFEKAFDNGAKACIIEDIEIEQEKLEKYKNKIIIKVKDSVEAIQKIAEHKRKMYKIPVIGITGSVGKTSTKDIVSSVMQTQFNTLKTNGNYNNQIGVPLTLLNLKDHEAAVIEMGMNHFGEIKRSAKITKPTMAVITNIGTSHIGILGSRENILKAKLEILEGMDEKAQIIINNDNDLLHNWYLKNKDTKNIITFGIENVSDVMAKDIESTEEGSTFEVEVKGKKYKAEIKVGGVHFVINSLCAICVGLENGITMEKILKGIKEFELTKNRMEIIEGVNRKQNNKR